MVASIVVNKKFGTFTYSVIVLERIVKGKSSERNEKIKKLSRLFPI